MIYFEIKNEDFEADKEWHINHLLLFCEKEYHTDPLEVIYSFEIDGKVRHCCMESTASTNSKISETWHLKRTFQDYKMVSSIV